MPQRVFIEFKYKSQYNFFFYTYIFFLETVCYITVEQNLEVFYIYKQH